MKLTNDETASLCRSLSLLLHSGIPTLEGLYLQAEEETGSVKDLCLKIAETMEQGAPLSDALEESGSFDRHVPGMVRIAEETGRMEETLASLADYYDQRSRTARQIRNALAYPGMILALMLLVIGVLLVEVLPVFDQVYASLGSGLTGLSGGLLRLGQVLKGALPFLGAILVLGAAAVIAVLRVPGWKQKCVDSYQRRWGDRWINRKFNNARFARGLAMGMDSGLPLEEALFLSEQLLSDIPHATQRCRQCSEAMRAGASIPEAMEAGSLLPPAHSRMLTLGIRSGSGDRVMERIADKLMEEAEAALERAVSQIEPAMVMATSALVGVILLSVMLPLLDLLTALG